VRALWLEDRVLRVRDDIAPPRPPQGEALVRVRLAGICNTDLELLAGYYPFRGVPGHEFVGVVEEAPGDPTWIGKRVVGEINAVCGACPTCRAGRPRHCERRTVLGIVARDGALATHLCLPLENLHAVPEELPDERAVFTEPTAAALEIQEQLRVARDDRVVVVGVGKLGNLVAQTLAATGCDLLAVGRTPRQLDLLTARGIRTGTAESIAERQADLVVECTGNADGLDMARRAVRPCGTIVLKSTYHGRTEIDMAPLVVDEITLVGSRCGPFGPALESLARGTVDPSPLVEARYTLDRAEDAFERAARPGALKVLVEC
jgi:threonine dehydrogenase-like Zn-dependent dehydrogenase